MCDFDNLYYNLKDELLRIYKESETPYPTVKIADLQSAKICGLPNLAKLVLYLEKEGYLVVTNKEEGFKNWEFRIEPAIFDLLFGYG